MLRFHIFDIFIHTDDKEQNILLLISLSNFSGTKNFLVKRKCWKTSLSCFKNNLKNLTLCQILKKFYKIILFGIWVKIQISANSTIIMTNKIEIQTSTFISILFETNNFQKNILMLFCINRQVFKKKQQKNVIIFLNIRHKILEVFRCSFQVPTK